MQPDISTQVVIFEIKFSFHSVDHGITSLVWDDQVEVCRPDAGFFAGEAQRFHHAGHGLGECDLPIHYNPGFAPQINPQGFPFFTLGADDWAPQRAQPAAPVRGPYRMVADAASLKCVVVK